MTSLIPSPYDVVHLPHVVSDEIDPDTGNPIVKELPAVTRKYQSLSQIGRIRGSSKNLHDAEFLDRVDTELHMSVAGRWEQGSEARCWPAASPPSSAPTSRCATSRSYFETRTLTPFAIYCALAGGASLVWVGRALILTFFLMRCP